MPTPVTVSFEQINFGMSYSEMKKKYMTIQSTGTAYKSGSAGDRARAEIARKAPPSPDRKKVREPIQSEDYRDITKFSI